jgi:hypothetical protein
MLKVCSILINALAEVLTAPLLRSYTANFSIKFPLFSGQIWRLPNLGLVKIVEISEQDDSVWYILYPFDDLGEIHKSPRKDFTRHCRQPSLDQEEIQKAENIVLFPNSEE